MDRRTARNIGVALLVVVAVGVAAATLTSTLESGNGLGTGSPGAPGGDDPGDDRNISGGPQPGGSGGAVGQYFCFPVVQTIEFQIGLFAVWVVLAAVLFWRLPRFVAVGLLASISIFLFGIYAVLLGLCNQGYDLQDVQNATDVPAMNFSEVSRSAGEGAQGTGAFISTNPILTAVIVVVAVALLVGLVYLKNPDRLGLDGIASATADEDDIEEEYSAQTLQMLGETAGQAADRIDDSGEAENEVYRAWREMTQYIDVDHPETSTPREFAAAATHAGMDADDVAELTSLFEDVRYGGIPPTDAAEDRAIEALRRIEASYAESEENA